MRMRVLVSAGLLVSIPMAWMLFQRVQQNPTAQVSNPNTIGCYQKTTMVNNGNTFSTGYECQWANASPGEGWNMTYFGTDNNTITYPTCAGCGNIGTLGCVCTRRNCGVCVKNGGATGCEMRESSNMTCTDVGIACPRGSSSCVMDTTLMSCDMLMPTDMRCYTAFCGDNVCDAWEVGSGGDPYSASLPINCPQDCHCGNNTFEPHLGEECDEGPYNGKPNLSGVLSCDKNCKKPGPVCGNNIKEAGEECDPGNGNFISPGLGSRNGNPQDVNNKYSANDLAKLTTKNCMEGCKLAQCSDGKDNEPDAGQSGGGTDASDVGCWYTPASGGSVYLMGKNSEQCARCEPELPEGQKNEEGGNGPTATLPNKSTIFAQLLSYLTAQVQDPCPGGHCTESCNSRTIGDPPGQYDCATDERCRAIPPFNDNAAEYSCKKCVNTGGSCFSTYDCCWGTVYGKYNEKCLFYNGSQTGRCGYGGEGPGVSDKDVPVCNVANNGPLPQPPDVPDGDDGEGGDSGTQNTAGGGGGTASAGASQGAKTTNGSAGSSGNAASAASPAQSRSSSSSSRSSTPASSSPSSGGSAQNVGVILSSSNASLAASGSSQIAPASSAGSSLRSPASSTSSVQLCGNGKVDAGEQCDNGSYCYQNPYVECTQTADCQKCFLVNGKGWCLGIEGSIPCTSHAECTSFPAQCTYNTTYGNTSCNAQCQIVSSASRASSRSSAFFSSRSSQAFSNQISSIRSSSSFISLASQSSRSFSRLSAFASASSSTLSRSSSADVLTGLPSCGDGRLHPLERCDDGNRLSGDGCSSGCMIESLNLLDQLYGIASCGDGKRHPLEACDDGNRSSGDGCSASCRNETVNAAFACVSDADCGGGRCIDGICAAWVVMERPIVPLVLPVVPVLASSSSAAPTPILAEDSFSSALAFCGNGRIELGEACDNGPDNSQRPNALCRTDCTPGRCGDGVIDTPLELCDDGNLLNNDGCSSLCQMERTAPQTLPAQVIDLPFQQPGVNDDQQPNPPPDSAERTVYPVPPQTSNTGPASLLVMLAGAAAGYSWVKRRR